MGSIERTAALNELYSTIIELHSFSYKTLSDAKKTICISDLDYCFDALSLCTYHHNLSEDENNYLVKKLKTYCADQCGKEANKERGERAILFHYLQADFSSPFRSYEITKETQPDFILYGEKTIGVEVVELTTPYDKVLYKISLHNFGENKSSEQIKADAEIEHGEKAKGYTYTDIDGIACIGTQMFNVDERKQHFAEQIAKKYEKYRDKISMFDEFIILCDAQLRVEMSSEYDLSDVIKFLSTTYSSIHNVSIAFLWNQNGSIRVSQCRL